MSEEDKKLQKQLVDEMMKVYETNPDVMLYMQSLMENYEKLEQENKQLEDLLHKANDEVISYTNCCIDLKEKIDNAIEYIQNHQLVFEISNKKQIAYWFDMFYKDILEILGDKE